MMKNSCFNIPVITGNRYAVWNSLCDNVVELSESEYLALLHNTLDEIDASRQQVLRQQGVLVDTHEEMQSFL